MTSVLASPPLATPSVPVDVLKTDRLFMSTVTTSVQSSPLVHRLIRLGGALSLDVITEGIEHPDRLQAMQESECHRAQGFSFARQSLTSCVRATSRGTRSPPTSTWTIGFGPRRVLSRTVAPRALDPEAAVPAP